MKYQWQALLERLWPSSGGPFVSHARRMAILQAAIALAIAVAWGPEIIAAMEMTTLLEMLGATLFLTAYAAGFELKAMELCRALRNIVVPVTHVAVIRSNAPASWKALTVISLAASATWCLGAFVVLTAYGQHLLRLAT